MPVSAWENVGPGVVASTLGAVDGIVVNGGGTGAPAPTTGRIYP